ncbi:MAG: acetyltransferase [Pseudomonadales bacterium]|uniref:acetyltransferase n=1 Tax=Moritella sp. TaxID=78556 RepID=UPI001DDEBC67|nr:acetyltransferase [Moritella sp.]MCJ8314566.1 acetyltransferase [Pseudomonadales bacterium]NQZ50764.1 acetyltransferase [Moritella sp.]
MLTNVLLVGAGGHAKVVIDAIKVSSPDCLIEIVDNNKDKVGQNIIDDIFVSDYNEIEQLSNQVFVSIGDCRLRKLVCNQLQNSGKKLISVYHKEASISFYSRIDDGVFIAAKSIVAASTVIHCSVILNHGSIVDHDCEIGEYSHIGPNVTLGGGVTVGKNTFIGSGAIILPMVKIGNNVVIGAGSVIISNIPDNQIFVGVPGRRIEK